MKPSHLSPIVLFVVLTILLASARAQTPAIPDGSPPASSQPEQAAAMQRAMTEGFQFRSELTKDISSGAEKAVVVLQRLRSHQNAMGLGFDADEDFTEAAMDIGYRLVALGKMEQAEIVFRTAETALGQSIDTTSDSSAQKKSRLLERRAELRESFLNMAPGAEADLAAALKIRPSDERLQRKRDSIATQKSGRKAAIGGAKP